MPVQHPLSKLLASKQTVRFRPNAALELRPQSFIVPAIKAEEMNDGTFNP